MRLLFDLRSYPARLVLGVFTLILLTTLSAGAPAYWLTRTESERQAWSHVAGAEQATYSLLLAEQERLDDLLMLLAERPTLRRLLREQSRADLASYLSAFREQSELDLLFLCQAGVPLDSAAAAAALADPCPEQTFNGFDFYESRPAMLSSRPIFTSTAETPPIIAVAGQWLDEAFLRRLAADTGVAQSLLLLDGTRVASSMGDRFLAPASSEVTFASGGRRLLDIDGRRFYTILIPLVPQGDRAALIVEVALPVDELMIARNRALTVLALSTGVVALIGALLGIWAVRRMIDPLEQLTHTAHAISAGDLATPIPMPHGPREVRTLARALRRSQASMLAALENLSQARDWLENLVQSIVEGVVIFDDEGRVTFLNGKAAELAGVTVEEAVGRHVDTLFPVTDESGNRVSVPELAFGGKHRVNLVKAAEPGVRPVRQPGQPIMRRLGTTPAQPEALAMLEITVTRLTAPAAKGFPLAAQATGDDALPDAATQGQELQTALVLRDISQEESLRRLRAYFLANITHEFRTPLSTWNASMELLLNEADLSAAEMRELLKPLHLSLLTLQTLIENLLESSAIEAGRFVLHRQRVDLEQVIADAVRIVQPLLERRRQTLARTEPAFLPALSGDPARLTQVLVNLLGNAGKYSPPGSTITLEIERRHDRLRVAVADRGPGIPPPERESLFRRFVRLSADTTDQYGIGLGLYVVKTTVEAHGGSVGVDEHAGGGSVFWFELPTGQEGALEQISKPEKTA